MIVRVDRRPRAPRTKRGPGGRLGTSLRRRFAGRAEIASDCEIRRPERQAMIAVVVITTVGAGMHRLPVWGRASVAPSSEANQGPDAARPVHHRGCSQTEASTRHPVEGFIPSITGGGCRAANASAAFCRSGTLLSSVIRETRSEATLVAPQHRDSDRAPAMPGPRHRGERRGVGDITHSAVRVRFS